VQLREALAPGATVEVELSFKGTVPEIDPDETSLPAHVVQQVGAAMHDTREVRRARDTNFVSRGVMLLGASTPCSPCARGRRLAAQSRGRRSATPSSPTRPTIRSQSRPRRRGRLHLGRRAVRHRPRAQRAHVFVGENLRGFALVAGRDLRKEEREVGAFRVRSVFTAEHEKVGRRVLSVAADAARTFRLALRPAPLKTVTVTEAPLVAGFGSAEFAGLAVIASAFYVDFDSPAMRALPELVREQRASVEDSLEFAAAQGVAQQWWGEAVGSDPAREAVVDEALAQWSALLYVQDVRGAERAHSVQEDQLRGVYQVYRTFGGEDRAADSPTREYRNSFQYAAIVASEGRADVRRAAPTARRGAKFFKALRALLRGEPPGGRETRRPARGLRREAELQQRRASRAPSTAGSPSAAATGHRPAQPPTPRRPRHHRRAAAARPATATPSHASAASSGAR
jgi:hypothetical protein